MSGATVLKPGPHHHAMTHTTKVSSGGGAVLNPEASVFQSTSSSSSSSSTTHYQNPINGYHTHGYPFMNGDVGQQICGVHPPQTDPSQANPNMAIDNPLQHPPPPVYPVGGNNQDPSKALLLAPKTVDVMATTPTVTTLDQLTPDNTAQVNGEVLGEDNQQQPSASQCSSPLTTPHTASTPTTPPPPQSDRGYQPALATPDTLSVESSSPVTTSKGTNPGTLGLETGPVRVETGVVSETGAAENATRMDGSTLARDTVDAGMESGSIGGAGSGPGSLSGSEGTGSGDLSCSGVSGTLTGNGVTGDAMSTTGDSLSCGSETQGTQTTPGATPTATPTPGATGGQQPQHPQAQQPLSRDQIKNLVTQQVEYFFSRENLSDPYLISQMDSDQYVPVFILANCSQFKNITKDHSIIVEALKESPYVQLDEEKSRVRPNYKRCIVILREIPETTPISEIEAMFKGEECPKLVSCEFVHNSSWYVTFESDEDAQKAYWYLRGVVKTFKGKPILARIKTKPMSRLGCLSVLPSYGNKASGTNNNEGGKDGCAAPPTQGPGALNGATGNPPPANYNNASGQRYMYSAASNVAANNNYYSYSSPSTPMPTAFGFPLRFMPPSTMPVRNSSGQGGEAVYIPTMQNPRGVPGFYPNVMQWSQPSGFYDINTFLQYNGLSPQAAYKPPTNHTMRYNTTRSRRNFNNRNTYNNGPPPWRNSKHRDGGGNSGRYDNKGDGRHNSGGNGNNNQQPPPPPPQHPNHYQQRQHHLRPPAPQSPQGAPHGAPHRVPPPPHTQPQAPSSVPPTPPPPPPPPPTSTGAASAPPDFAHNNDFMASQSSLYTSFTPQMPPVSVGDKKEIVTVTNRTTGSSMGPTTLPQATTTTTTTTTNTSPEHQASQPQPQPQSPANTPAPHMMPPPPPPHGHPPPPAQPQRHHGYNVVGGGGPGPVPANVRGGYNDHYHHQQQQQHHHHQQQQHHHMQRDSQQPRQNMRGLRRRPRGREEEGGTGAGPGGRGGSGGGRGNSGGGNGGNVAPSGDNNKTPTQHQDTSHPPPPPPPPQFDLQASAFPPLPGSDEQAPVAEEKRTAEPTSAWGGGESQRFSDVMKGTAKPRPVSQSSASDKESEPSTPSETNPAASSAKTASALPSTAKNNTTATVVVAAAAAAAPSLPTTSKPSATVSSSSKNGSLATSGKTSASLPTQTATSTVPSATTTTTTVQTTAVHPTSQSSTSPSSTIETATTTNNTTVTTSSTSSSSSNTSSRVEVREVRTSGQRIERRGGGVGGPRERRDYHPRDYQRDGRSLGGRDRDNRDHRRDNGRAGKENRPLAPRPSREERMDADGWITKGPKESRAQRENREQWERAEAAHNTRQHLVNGDSSPPPQSPKGQKTEVKNTSSSSSNNEETAVEETKVPPPQQPLNNNDGEHKTSWAKMALASKDQMERLSAELKEKEEQEKIKKQRLSTRPQSKPQEKVVVREREGKVMRNHGPPRDNRMMGERGGPFRPRDSARPKSPK